MSAERPGLLELCAPDTLVCRCEEVSRAQVDACLADGHVRLDTVKRITRVGMGYCQGRICAPTVAALARTTGASAERIGWFNARPPLRPLPLEAFAESPPPGQASEKEV